MSALEQAKTEAIERIRQANDKTKNGLIIWKTAQEYGIGCSDLAREIAHRQKEERKRVARLVWLDMDKVKALGCGGDLGKIAKFCNLGHDTLRIAEGRDGKGVRWATVQKMAERFGVDADGLLHDENKQLSIPAKQGVSTDASILITDCSQFTEEENRLIRVLAIWNGISEEEVKTRIIKRFLLEADTMITKL